MEEAIKEKLRNALTEPIEKESQVVYIMVEMRKLIEREKEKIAEKEQENYYPYLLFFCDWFVHAFMDRNKTKKVLLEIEKKVKQSDTDFFSFLNFEEITIKIKEFLENFNLPYDNIINRKKYFRKLIYNILLDCPLKMRNPSNGQIKEFRLVKNNQNKNNITRYSCEIMFEGKQEPFSVTINEIN